MRYQTYTSGVYAIYDLNRNCIYVGATKDFDVRYKQHLKMLFDGNHHNRYFQDYCNKIGVQNLVFTPIFYCQESEIFFYEKKFIHLLSPYVNMNINTSDLNPVVENANYYKIATSKYLETWVSAEQLSKDFETNLKKTGMICKALGFRKKKERKLNNLVFYYIL